MKIVIGTKGAPNREPKQEKYDFPVVILHAKPAAIKGSYKISFNKAAQEALSLIETDEVSVVIGLEHPVLVKVTNLDVEKYSLYKKLDFASKPVHDIICKKTSVSAEIENEFAARIKEIDYEDGVIIGLELYSKAEDEVPQVTEDVEETPVDEADHQIHVNQATEEVHHPDNDQETVQDAED